MTGQPNFRPPKRHKADIDEWKILRKLKLGPCRVCGHPKAVGQPFPVELHHLVGRDLGGDDLPENLVALCTYHHKLIEERNPGSCHLLREVLMLKEYAYVLENKGVDFLNRYYPRRSAEDVGTAA